MKSKKEFEKELKLLYNLSYCRIVNIDYKNYTFSVRSKRFNFDDISFPKQLIRKCKLEELLKSEF